MHSADRASASIPQVGPAAQTASQGQALGLVVVFLLNLILRIFYLRYDFLNGDEAVRALTALGLLDGGTLYIDVVTDKPPGATLFYAGVIAIFGRSMAAVHLVAWLWHFATSLVIFITGRCFYSTKAGVTAALVFIYFSATYHTQDMMAANTEMLMALPYVASFYVFMTARDRPLSLVLAGALTGMAVIFKQVGVFNMLFFAILEIASAVRQRSLKRPVWRLTLVATGFAIVAGVVITWLAATGAAEAFWRNAVQVAARYSGALPRDLWLRFFLSRVSAYVLFNAALWGLAIWVIIRKADAENTRRFDLTIALWGVISLSGVFTSGRFFGHYFIQALPALSLLAGRGILMLMEQHRRPHARARVGIAIAAVVISILFGAVRFHQRTAILAYETVTGFRTRLSEAWGMERRERETEEVAEYVRERIGEGKPLFIWGYALDVYWKSRCKPASRYLTPYYVTGYFYPDAPPPAEAEDPFWASARAQFIEDLERSKPRVILNIDEAIWSLPYPEIVSFITENYRYRERIGQDPARPFLVFERRKRLESIEEPLIDNR
jgi:hypothetical protein